MKFYIRNFKNLVVRLVTFNKYYVCDECRKVHKRDGSELDLTPETKHRGAWVWWYPSCCQSGVTAVMNRACDALHEGLFGVADSIRRERDENYKGSQWEDSGV